MHRGWRVTESGENNLGLASTKDGLILGPTLLIDRRDGRFVVRKRGAVERLLRRAYGADLAVDRLMTGLAILAAALNANDQAWRGLLRSICGFRTCRIRRRERTWKLRISSAAVYLIDLMPERVVPLLQEIEENEDANNAHFNAHWALLAWERERKSRFNYLTEKPA